MKTFLEFILLESSLESHMWGIPHNNVEIMKSTPKIVNHAKWFSNEKIPERKWEHIPRGRAIINHKDKEIKHLDYGFGVHPKFQNKMKTSFPNYSQVIRKFDHGPMSSGD